MIDREWVHHVRQALARKDAETPGEVPDYDVLAEAAVVATIELMARREIAKLKREIRKDRT